MDRKKSMKKHIWVAVKVILSVVAFWFVFKSVDFKEMLHVLKVANPLLLIGALIMYILGQSISSKRLQIILHAVQSYFPFVWNLKLYFLGMAYNLFLPGGVGGDAYKMFVYARKADKKPKDFILPLLADRIAGMLGIVLLMTALIMLIPNTKDWWNSSLFFGLTLIGIIALYFITRKWFQSYQQVLLPAISISVLVQVFQVTSTLLIAYSIGAPIEMYFVVASIFLISSLATAVPLFLGGLGARELVFGTMFPLFGLHSETGVLVAVIFSMIVVISSLPGLLFSFSKD